MHFVEGGGKEEYDITHHRSLAAGRPDAPADHVSWFEADAFARSRAARLPTEAEWEKAATWNRRNAGTRGLLEEVGSVWEWTSSPFGGYSCAGSPSFCGAGHDRLLVGTDLVKDVGTLEAAYNDSEGVTAVFNRSVLRVSSRELDADFDVDALEHVAFHDHDREWNEMRLRAQRRMEVRVPALDLDLPFAAREEMRTEISATFTRERLHADLAAAGLRPVEVMTDPDGLFALSLSELPGRLADSSRSPERNV